MRRLFAIAAGALVLAPAAFAGGNNPAGLQDDQGALNAEAGVRYVASGSGANTMISALSTTDNTVLRSLKLTGQWGIPRIDQGASASLSNDGKTLVLARTQIGAPTTFTVVDATALRVRKTITLHGSYAFDALSPKGAMLYLIKYPGDDTSRYVVKALNMKTGKLLPGRIADKTQNNWIMQGLAVTRVTSADGRWVYTLYANPGGYAFVHALDTVKRTAHCVGIPWKGDSNKQWEMRLALRDDGRLGVNWQSGAPYVAIDRFSWKIDYLGQ
jgi:hypothetical protein